MAADSAHAVAAESLAGHVVVVAARSGADAVAVALAGTGMTVAVITDDRRAVSNVETAAAGSTSVLAFCADPTEVDVWTRIAAHLEQRLGPVDAVVADSQSRDAAIATMADDLRRRGHGGVVAIDAADVVRAVREAIRRTL
jgi:hypothetical protein